MCDEIYWNCSTGQLNSQSRTSWCQASGSSESLYLYFEWCCLLQYFGPTKFRASTLITDKLACNCGHRSECPHDRMVFALGQRCLMHGFWDRSVSGLKCLVTLHWHECMFYYSQLQFFSADRIVNGRSTHNLLKSGFYLWLWNTQELVDYSPWTMYPSLHVDYLPWITVKM